MIPKDLLLSKGTVDGLVALAKDGPCTTSELEGPMNLSDSTVRTRMESLKDEGLVAVEAAMRDDQPVRVYTLTNDGQKVASSVRTLIGETPPVPENVERKEDDEDADTGETDDSEDEPDPEDIKPSGATFAGDGDSA